MTGEADALSGLTELQVTNVLEEEMSEVDQMNAVVGGTQTGTIAIEEDSPASSESRRATRLLQETREKDAIVPEYGGPSTQTARTMAREGDELVADLRRVPEGGWRQTAKSNIDAPGIDCGKPWEQIPPVSSAYSSVMRPPREELLLSERDRGEIAAERIDFFERLMARTVNRVVENAPSLSEDFMTLGLAEEEIVIKRRVRSLAEERQAGEKGWQSLQQKAKMDSTLIDPRDFLYPLDEDGNVRGNSKTKSEKEDVLARRSTLLQTASGEPALLNFEVNVSPTVFHSDMMVMWSTCNFNTPVEPDNGASAEPGEPSGVTDEEVTLARLTNNPARPGGLATATHMELAHDLEVALASSINNPQMPGGLATHMDLSEELVQGLESLTIRSSNVGVAEQQEQVEEHVNARSSPSADFDAARLMARRSRSRERYRPYSAGARRSLYMRSGPRSSSPDRRRRARSHSRDRPRLRSWDPTQIASASSVHKNPGRRALEADGLFRPRPNVRRHSRRRANAEFHDYSSSKEKILESE